MVTCRCVGDLQIHPLADHGSLEVDPFGGFRYQDGAVAGEIAQQRVQRSIADLIAFQLEVDLPGGEHPVLQPPQLVEEFLIRHERPQKGEDRDQRILAEYRQTLLGDAVIVVPGFLHGCHRRKAAHVVLDLRMPVSEQHRTNSRFLPLA